MTGRRAGRLPRRVACLLLPRFLIQVAAISQPDLPRYPAAITDGDRLVAVTVGAAAAGLRPGQSVVAALERYPTLVIVPDDTQRRAAVTTRLLALGERVSPTVEPARPGLFFLDWSGLGGTAAGELPLAQWLTTALADELHLSGQVGIADGPFIAAVAARHRAQPGRPGWVAGGAGAAFLADFDLAILPGIQPFLPRLAALGLRHVGELAALPVETLTSRFGSIGHQLHQLANGRDRRPLQPLTTPDERILTLSCEPPESLIDRLLFLLARALNQLWEELASAGLTASGLILTLTLVDGEPLILSLPLLALTGLNRLLLETLQAQLTGADLPAPVAALTVRLTGVLPERGRQLALADAGRAARQPRQLETISRLTTLLGPGSVRRARLRPALLPEQTVDLLPWSDHRAEASPPLEQTPTLLPAWPGLRLYHPPRAIRVTLANGRPAAFHDGLAWRPIIALAGPYRVATGWWNSLHDRLERDYYLIAAAADTRLLLMVDLATGHWVITAELD